MSIDQRGDLSVAYLFSTSISAPPTTQTKKSKKSKAVAATTEVDPVDPSSSKKKKKKKKNKEDASAASSGDAIAEANAAAAAAGGAATGAGTKVHKAPPRVPAPASMACLGRYARRQSAASVGVGSGLGTWPQYCPQTNLPSDSKAAGACAALVYCRTRSLVASVGVGSSM